MSPSVAELIGQIINPQWTPRSEAQATVFAIPAEPVSVLIGRIIAPHGPAAAPVTVEVPMPAPAR